MTHYPSTSEQSAYRRAASHGLSLIPEDVESIKDRWLRSELVVPKTEKRP